MPSNIKSALQLKAKILNRSLEEVEIEHKQKLREDALRYPTPDPVPAKHEPEAPDFYSFERPNKKRIKTVKNECKYCLGEIKYIARSTYASLYFELEESSILVNQLFIIPNQHISNTRELEQDTKEEIRNFQKTLIKLFSTRGFSIIFYENASEIGPEYLARFGPHVKIDCFPVPSNLLATAKTWFMKNMQDLGKNWDAKSFFEVKDKALDSTIPKKFPYIYVDFNLGGGYLYHCRDKIGKDFINSIISSIFQLSRFHKPYSNSNYKTVVERFINDYTPYNWVMPDS